MRQFVSGLTLFVAMCLLAPVGQARAPTIPVDGGTPVSTGISMEGVRDLSIHPDGRRIAFNAGWKNFEHWAVENLLAK